MKIADQWKHVALRGSFALAMFALSWFFWGHESWPDKQQLSAIHLHLKPGEQQTLGSKELHAPAADRAHLKLGRDQAGRWWISNNSTDRSVAWRSSESSGSLRQTQLQTGQHLWVADHIWKVLSTVPALHMQEVQVSEQGQEPHEPQQGAQPQTDSPIWVYDGFLLRRLDTAGDVAAAAPSACPGVALAARWRHLWNTQLPSVLGQPASLQWGGQSQCGNRLPQRNLPVGSLIIRFNKGSYWLHGSGDSSRQVCLLALTDGTCPAGATLFEQAMTVEQLTHITVGRTTFALRIDRDQLTLQPVRRGGWKEDNGPGLSASSPSSLAWEYRAFNIWQWPASMPLPLTVALAGLGLSLWAAWRHVRQRVLELQALAEGLTLSAVLVSLVLYFQGAAVGPGSSLAWCLVAIVLVPLALPAGGAWSWLSHACLAMMLLMGLALQTQLGLKGVDTGAWLYLQKTASLGATGLYALLFAGVRCQSGSEASATKGRLTRQAWEVGLAASMLLALALLVLQVLLGGEEGVFGIQPVEFAKLALILSGAHALAVQLEASPQTWGSRFSLWFFSSMPVLLLMSLGALALLLLQDYSPLLLMGIWLIGLLAAWWLASRSWQVLLLVMFCLGLGGGLWTWLALGDGAAWMQVHGFYGERFAVWVQPHLHPHNGEQVLRAIRLALRGGWWGDELVNPWRVPAVQDDMAPSFFVGRFGLVAAWGLWAVQFLYLTSLLAGGWQALSAIRPGDHRRRWSLRLTFFATWGAAAMFAGHLLLSWGTNTGWLPVMGQPMPLLSSGGSIIVLLLVPLHLLWQFQASRNG